MTWTEIIEGVREFMVNQTYIFGLVSLCWFLFGIVLGKSLPGVSRQAKKGGRTRSGSGSSSAVREPTGGQCELYVGNLPYDTSERQLKKMFDSYGKIAGVRIITNKSSGASKGYGFVMMAHASDARAAAKGMDSQKVEGRKIIVNEAKSRKR